MVINSEIADIINSLQVEKPDVEKTASKNSEPIIPDDAPDFAKDLIKLSQELADEEDNEKEPEKKEEGGEDAEGEPAGNETEKKGKEAEEEPGHVEENGAREEDKNIQKAEGTQEKVENVGDGEPVEKEAEQETKNDSGEDADKEVEKSAEDIPMENPGQPEQEVEKAENTEEIDPGVAKAEGTEEKVPDIDKAEGTQDAEQKLGAFNLGKALNIGVPALAAGGVGYAGYQFGKAKEKAKDPMIVNTNAQVGFNRGYQDGARLMLSEIDKRMPDEMKQVLIGSMGEVVKGAAIDKVAALKPIHKWAMSNLALVGLGLAGGAAGGVGGFQLGKLKEKGNDENLSIWGSRRGYDIGLNAGAVGMLESIKSKIPEEMLPEFEKLMGGNTDGE